MVTTITKRGVMDMKKIIAILLITIMAIGTAACQKTPESPIVVGKNNEKLIEKAVTSRDTPFSAPSRYSADEPLTNPQGSLTVNVDAAVIVPNSDGLSTARVEKHLFTEAECQTYIAALFDGQTTYSGDVFETKAYYQQTILDWQRQLALETDEQKRQEVQGSITKFQMAMESLPEGEGLVEAPIEFSTTLSGVPTIFLVSDGNDGKYRKIFIENNSSTNQYRLIYSIGQNDYAKIGNLWNVAVRSDIKHGTDEYGSPDLLPAPSIEQNQAVNAANELLSLMGVSDYSYKTSSLVFGSINGTVQKAYRLSYSRILGNNSFTLTSAPAGGGGAIDDGKGGHIEGWEYESMTFLVNNDGIVSMEWINPYDVSEVITNNTSMMDFNDVMDIFNKMIVVTNAYLSDDMSKTINVDRIELGLMRITDPATRSSGLVIPVWDFFGNVTTAFKNGEKSYSELDDDPLNSVLAINAIDGTLVDRSRGY